jgi:hypothetical protein
VTRDYALGERVPRFRGEDRASSRHTLTCMSSCVLRIRPELDKVPAVCRPLSGFGHAYHRLPDAWQVSLGERGSRGTRPCEASIAVALDREFRVCRAATARRGVTGQLGHGMM